MQDKLEERLRGSWKTKRRLGRYMGELKTDGFCGLMGLPDRGSREQSDHAHTHHCNRLLLENGNYFLTNNTII